MTKEEFFTIFDNDIFPIIKEIQDNNSMIWLNDLDLCKKKIYEEYVILNQRYKQPLIDYIKKERQKVEVYFYYVNEFIAFRAAIKFLSFFMVNERKGQEEAIRAILRDFPQMPPTTKNKRGFWNSVVFNLSQVKDGQQIGVEHYDMYAYAMFFFWLESYFNEKLAA